MERDDDLEPDVAVLNEVLIAAVGAFIDSRGEQQRGYVEAAIDAMGVLGDRVVALLAAIPCETHRPALTAIFTKHVAAAVERLHLKLMMEQAGEGTMQ